MVAKTAIHWLGVVAILALGVGATAPAEAASPTPISACPYEIDDSGNYVVTQNLTSTGTCITIRGRNHALDLQGHTISGNGKGYGIVCVTDGELLCNTNVVANGTVTHFSAGVFLDGNYNTVAQITSQQNTGINSDQAGAGVGITLLGDFGNVITASVATNNALVGISGDEGALLATTVTDSQSNNNGNDGIVAVGVVSNSTANNNVAFGIFDAVTVTGSTAKGNGAGGIRLLMRRNTPNYRSVVNSTASGNKGNGIEAIGNVISSTANNNTDGGIRLHCPVSAYGNTAVSNPGGNISPTDNTCVLLDNKTAGQPSP